MKNKLLDNSIIFIKKYNSNYSEYDIEKIRYGLEGLYLTITKLVILLIFAAIIGILKELIIVLLFFNIIRFPAFGVHADKSSICLFGSLLFMVGLTYIFNIIYISPIVKLIVCIICFIDYLIFAPADTHKRPLTNKKKRKYRKFFSCLIAIIYIVLIILFNNKNISNLIFTSLILEALMINPIIYKLFNVPFNNYKKV